jgi:tryptophan 2-monooxygenase
MTSAVPTALYTGAKPITMFGPDFPFPYDDYLNHPDGLGTIPPRHYCTEVAIIGGGLSGIVTAYELMKLGFKPVLYEAVQLGGRLRSVPFSDYPDTIAEMGAMRFPPSATALFHYIDKCGLTTRPFPNPLVPATPSTMIDLKGQPHYARTKEDLLPIYQEVDKAWHRTLRRRARFAKMQAAIRSRDVASIKAIWNKLIPRLDNETF